MIWCDMILYNILCRSASQGAGQTRPVNSGKLFVFLSLLKACGVCIYLSLYLSIYLSLSLYIYIYIQREREIDMYICISVYMYICVSVYLYVCIYIYIYTYISLSLYIYIYVYIYIYICMTEDLLRSHLRQGVCLPQPLEGLYIYIYNIDYEERDT